MRWWCRSTAPAWIALTPVLLEALEAELSPKTIVLKNDSPVRELEGLKREVVVAKGEAEGAIELIENGAKFVADLSGGQKTGWFYDQRDNRRFMAGLAKDASVLDVYSYSGGFGVLAAKQGAKSVTCIDRSAAALDAARQAAKLNGVDKIVSFEKSEAFEALEKLGGTHRAQEFDVVICDPPAFVKSRKDLKTGAQGYRKLVRLAAPLVARGGFLFVASCSHLVDPPMFADQVRRGLRDAERNGRILLTLRRRARSSGASRPAGDGLSQGADPAARLIHAEAQMLKPGPRNLITDVDGLLVGNAEDTRLRSGVSVLLGERPFVASVDVRGGGPGTRDTDLLIRPAASTKSMRSACRAVRPMACRPPTA